MKIGLMLSLSCLAASLLSARAAVVFRQDFPSSATGDLNGLVPAVNTLGNNSGAAWNAHSLWKANGSFSTASSANDRGAWLPLGAGVMEAMTNYVITIDYENLNQGILYFGLQSNSAINTGARAQNQGTLTVGGAVRNFQTRSEMSLLQATGQEAVTSTPFAATGTWTATLSSNNLTDAVLSVGDQSYSFDATGLNHVILAWEQGGGTASTIRVNSLVIDAVPVPEASSLLLAGAGLLILNRRRRILHPAA